MPRILERITLVAPLGLRFWDPLSQAAIGEGLNVVAYPQADPRRVVEAMTNRSGVYFFPHLPGLHDFRVGVGDAAFWAGLPPPRAFVVEVRDDGHAAERFLPFQFQISVPARGLYQFDCALATSPPNMPPDAIPLYSSPARAVPGGMAAIRAELHKVDNGEPAAFALLEAQMGGSAAVGMADDQGRVVVIMPYPKPTAFSITSPTSTPRRALADQSWPVQLRAFYSPLLSPLTPSSRLPDLCAVLNQTPVRMLASLSPNIELSEETLCFGSALVLKTSGQSVLYISV